MDKSNESLYTAVIRLGLNWYQSSKEIIILRSKGTTHDISGLWWWIHDERSGKTIWEFRLFWIWIWTYEVMHVVEQQQPWCLEAEGSSNLWARHLGIIGFKGAPSASYDLPGGVTAERRYEAGSFYRKNTWMILAQVQKVWYKRGFVIFIAEYQELIGSAEGSEENDNYMQHLTQYAVTASF